MLDQAALEMVAADEAFSGVVIAEAGGVAVSAAIGSADRANSRPNRLDTRFATASMTKGFTAVATVSLVETGDLTLGTRLRDLVGDDLPNVDPGVTIEALLGHRSGVGDYLDEELLDDIDEHVPGAPSSHTFETPDDYLPVVATPPQVSPPGEHFAYNNGGFIMLSVAIERASGRGFHDIVGERVFNPAGMTTAGFFRADDLPARTALGYLQSGRTNIFHLPVVGGGRRGCLCHRGGHDRLLGGAVRRSLAQQRQRADDARIDRTGTLLSPPHMVCAASAVQATTERQREPRGIRNDAVETAPIPAQVHGRKPCLTRGNAI